MASSMTYGQLYDQLHRLKFTHFENQKNDKTFYVFEHKTIQNALIILPKRKRDDIVERSFIHSVLVTLKRHHLVSDVSPLEMMQNANETKV